MDYPTKIEITKITIYYIPPDESGCPARLPPSRNPLIDGAFRIVAQMDGFEEEEEVLHGTLQP